MLFKQLKQFAQIQGIELEINPICDEEGTVQMYEVGMCNPYRRHDWRSENTWFWFTTCYEDYLHADSYMLFRNRYSCATGRNDKSKKVGVNLILHIYDVLAKAEEMEENEPETESESESETRNGEPETGREPEKLIEKQLRNYLDNVKHISPDEYTSIAIDASIIEDTKKGIKNLVANNCNLLHHLQKMTPEQEKEIISFFGYNYFAKELEEGKKKLSRELHYLTYVQKVYRNQYANIL